MTRLIFQWKIGQLMASEIFRYQGCFAAKALWARVQGFGNPLFISEAEYCRIFQRVNHTRGLLLLSTPNRKVEIIFEVTTF